jgi:hypothetical protein
MSALTAKCLVTILSLKWNAMINLYINERRVENVTILDLKGRERIRGATMALHESIRCLPRETKIGFFWTSPGSSH